MDKKPEPLHIIDQRFLDHVYDGYQAGQRYCFILGAGASVTSGIRSGLSLMREWHSYLSERGTAYIQDAAQAIQLQPDDYEKLFQPGYTLQSEDYFTIFDLRFAGQPNVACAALEQEMEGKFPSSGYFSLAMLLAHTENRLVISTNFDSLVEDSLFIYTEKHPLVVGHESLAPFLSSEYRHPMVAKLHRDLLFRPMNRKEEMAKLAKEWEPPLRSALSRYIPIVIGYAGGDKTLMSLLQEVQLNNLYWCYRDKEPDPHICETVARHHGHLVKIFGFDEILLQLWTRFQKDYPHQDACDILKDQAKKRCDLYQDSLKKVNQRFETNKPTDDKGAAPDAAVSTAPKNSLEDILLALEQQTPARRNNSSRIPSTIYLQAQAAYLQGDYAAALSQCNFAISQAPAEAKFYSLKSNILHRLSNYEESLSAINTALTLDPQNAEYYDSRSATLHAMERYEDALADCNKAIDLNPKNAAYYESRSATLHAMNRYEDALVDCNKAIELAPKKAKFYKSRGVTLHEMKRYVDALTDESKAIELDPQNAVFYKSRGVTLHAMNRYEDALTDKSKAIELDPQNADFYKSRGITLRAMKRYIEALEDASKAIELEPQDAEFYKSRSVTLRAMKRYDEALEDASKAIELDPKNAVFYDSRGITLHEMKRYEDALTDTSMAIELDPQDAESYNSRSTTLRAMNRYEEALEDANKAVALAPESETYLRSRATTLRAMGRTEEAAQDEAAADALSAKK